MAARSRTTRARASGRAAAGPWRLPAAAWRTVAARTWQEARDDNIGLVAAGVAFYGFVALVPSLVALVLAYGFFADPARVVADMRGLMALLPADAAHLIGEQLMAAVTASAEKKGAGLLLALALALYGARSGAAAIVTGLNIAYEVKETRSFLRTTLLALAITAATILLILAILLALAALARIEQALPDAAAWALVAGRAIAGLLLLLAGAAAVAALYRYAPDRGKARWAWLSPGSLGAATLWLAASFGFGAYAARFGHYGATYGSLGAVVVLLTWLYLSSYVLLLGAELNAELEQRTAAETVAREMPKRGKKRASPRSGARRGK